MIVYQPPSDSGDILYRDSSIMVVNKPAGLLSVPGRAAEHKDCMISRIQMDHPDALIVHRLDMSTSGLLVIARSKETHRHLSRQFAERQVGKIYIAIVAGRVDPLTGQIDLPLICDWPNRPRQIVDHKAGKPSVTEYRVLSFNAENDTTRVELKPETGRTHQLRVHMQALGHPILGDDLYADDIIKEKSERLLLHAESLSFYHPLTLEPVDFKQEAPF